MLYDRETRPSACPEYAELEAFHAGRLSEARLVEIVAHLAECEPCETVVESLGRGDGAVAAVVAGVRSREAIDDEPVFRRLQAWGRAEPSPREGFASEPAAAVSGGDGSQATSVSGPALEARTETWKDLKQGGQLLPSEEGQRVPLPENIGPYFVVRELGSGGFGIVYLARRGTSDQQVAIKVPKAGPGVTEKEIQSFLREARTVAELQHPLIVQVRDFLRLPDYGCCVEMQFFEGGSLQELLKRERVSWEFAAKLIVDVAEALSDVHAHGISHRDLKPANILLDGKGRPHLTDFGLALLDGERWLHRGELAGTRAYMSPEQVQRRTEFIDARTDIWSLGVILYEMLTRERPFRGGTAEQVEQEILRKRPNPRVINTQVPVALAEICAKCLEQDLSKRYATTVDLASDLRRWLKPKWPRTVLAALVGAVGVALVALSVGYLRHPAEPTAGSTPDVEAAGGAEAERTKPDSGELASPDQRDPFRWKEQCGEVPALLMSSYRGATDFGFRNSQRAFEIVSDRPCLVRLGRFSRTPHGLSISLRQPTWTGMAGIFLGYRQETVDGRLVARFQAVHLQTIESQKSGQWMARVGRSLLEFEPDSGNINGLKDLGTVDVTLEPRDRYYRLELQFGAEGIERIRWGNGELPDLVQAEFEAADLLGPWGVFHTSGTTWFQDPLVTNVER